MKLTREEREQIARRRLINILSRHGIALARKPPDWPKWLDVFGLAIAHESPLDDRPVIQD